MSKLIVARNVCDVWSDPNQSERVSQAILGQTVLQSAAGEHHLHVSTPDTYRGHVRKHALVVPQKTARKKSQLKQVKSLFAPVHRHARVGAELMTTLVMSTIVPVIGHYRDFVRVQFPDETTGWVRNVHLGRPVTSRQGGYDARTVDGITKRAVDTAAALVGTPYLWGGCTPYGIDCSGLTQLCYAMSGVQLLRDAWMQMDDPRFESVATGQAFDAALLRAGDLVFFGTTDPAAGTRKVTHVGMILSDGRMIHSAGGYGVGIDDRKQHRLAGAYLGARRLSER